MITVHVLLLILAFISFILACFSVPSRVNWVALGLALWVLAELLGGMALSLK